MSTHSPTASPHSNWQTAPLLPRKSPERLLNRRLNLGHKVTQSLDLPRGPPKFDELALSADDSQTKSRLDLSQPTESGEQNGVSKNTKPPISNQLSSPTTNDPFILAPRPRRHTDLRALETSSLSPAIQHDGPGISASQRSPVSSHVSKLGSPRMSRLDTINCELPVRRHVRGARSLSPQRHDKTESPFLGHAPRQSFSQFSRAEKLSRLPASHSFSDLTSTSAPETVSETPAIARSSTMGELHQVNAGKDHESPVDDLDSPIMDAVPKSEVDTEKLLQATKDAAISSAQSATGLDWATNVLLLTDRKQLRQRRLTNGASDSLTLPLYEMRQEATALIEKLMLSEQLPRAQYIQATLLEVGRGGLPMDRKEAFRLYKEASKAGFARADYRIGQQFEKAGDLMKARENYERGASRDDVACLYRLGLLIFRGQARYEVDHHKAVSCIHLSALSADTDAPHGAFLWALMLAGEVNFNIPPHVMTQNLTEARHFMTKAAALGFAPAQLRMGKAHEFNELECAFSPSLSMHYYTLAGLGDNPEGELGMSKWYLAGSDDGAIQKDEQKAFFHADMAARRGLASAEFAMGYLCEVGVGCSSDLPKAQFFYRRAADHGSIEAKARIEGIMRSGTLSRKEHDFNVSTKIQARHATIKLNQKQASRYRGRSISNLPQSTLQQPIADSFNENVVRRDIETARIEAPSWSSKLRDMPEVEEDVTPDLVDQVESLTVSAHTGSEDVSYTDHQTTPQATRRTRSPIHEPFAAGHVHRGSMQGDSAPRTPTRDHRRTQSSLPQSPRWNLVDSYSSPKVQHHRDQSYSGSIGSGHVQAPEMPVDSRIRSWNQENASHSGPTSPNLAPSELGSTLSDGPSLPSPRPESSVSNIMPFRAAQTHTRQSSEATSLPSLRMATSSVTSSGVPASSSTSLSGSSKRVAATFEEMGIPMVNKKKEDCLIM